MKLFSLILLVLVFSSCGKNTKTYLYEEDSNEFRHFQTMEQEKCLNSLEEKLVKFRAKTTNFKKFKVQNRFQSNLKDKKITDLIVQDDLVQVLKITDDAIYAKISGENSLCPENELGCVLRYSKATSMKLFDVMLNGHCQEKLTIKSIKGDVLKLDRSNHFEESDKKYIRDSKFELNADFPEFLMSMNYYQKKTIKEKNKKDIVKEYAPTIKKLNNGDQLSNEDMLNLKVCEMEIYSLTELASHSRVSNLFKMNCLLSDQEILNIQNELLAD